MKKRIIIGVVALVVFLAIGFAYLNYRNRTLSPPGKTELTSNGLTVTVSYSRPSVRGRLIFGTEEQKALQPYGKYWRLGANESTEITINKNAFFNGQPVNAGSYRMYAIPGSEAFDIVLNSETGKWGAFEPDTSLDVLHTKVPSIHLNQPIEQYSISMTEADGGVNIVFEWSDTRFIVPVKLR